MAKKYKKALVMLTGMIILLFTGKVNAGYVSKSTGTNGYSLVGLNVLNVTFHASGYSYANSGSVSNMYFTDWSQWSKTISNRLPWKLHVPCGRGANGSILIGVRVNSPWGAVNLWGGQHYYSLDFQNFLWLDRMNGSLLDKQQ